MAPAGLKAPAAGRSRGGREEGPVRRRQARRWRMKQKRSDNGAIRDRAQRRKAVPGGMGREISRSKECRPGAGRPCPNCGGADRFANAADGAFKAILQNAGFRDRSRIFSDPHRLRSSPKTASSGRFQRFSGSETGLQSRQAKGARPGCPSPGPGRLLLPQKASRLRHPSSLRMGDARSMKRKKGLFAPIPVDFRMTGLFPRGPGRSACKTVLPGRL